MAFIEYLDINNVEKDPWYKAIGKSAALILTIPITVIEGIIRGVFAFLATPILLLLPDGKVRDWYNEHIFSPIALGSLVSFNACPFAIMALGMGVAVLFGKLVDACSSSSGSKIAKMPPSIWCCYTRTAEKASS